jgi:hypothetical protein
MSVIDTINASSEFELFPVENLLDYDPNKLWIASSFAAQITILIDFGSAKPINAVWLNNANFLSATIEANSSDSWASPPVSVSATMAEDGAGVVKGFFDVAAADYRYVRIVIPVQSLLDGGAYPWLGNIIIGEPESIIIGDWGSDIEEETDEFKSTGGNYDQNIYGVARHIFTASMVHADKSEIDAAPLKGWSYAVWASDLGSVADSWLVCAPTAKSLKIRNVKDCDLSFKLRQRV